MDEVDQLFGPGKSPEDVFNDFKGRRAGILKALTTDVDKFFTECDPEKAELCLFGYSDESWKVAESSENVPTDVPEPTVGINFSRGSISSEVWLAYVAMHSDSWLISLSFFLGALCKFDKTSRRELFNLINDLPTIHEMVTQGHTRSVESVFRDFKARRAGILKALTTDVKKFFQECDPEKDNLFLYGDSNERWKLDVPRKPNIVCMPVPTLGINFARDGMSQKEWLTLVAAHSDVWLLSVSFFFGHGFNKESREKLFNLINGLPTIREIVIRAHAKNKNPSDSSKANKSAPKASNLTKVLQTPPPTQKKKEGAEEEEEEMEDSIPCSACGKTGEPGDFWIFCDTCECWYHGVCVDITSKTAKRIERYECPQCHNKRTAGFV